jgi:hypothetical protein
VTLLPADLVFFRFMTLTTVGYGDIIPISAEARLVAVFEAVAGVFLLAFLAARLVRCRTRRRTIGIPPGHGQAYLRSRTSPRSNVGVCLGGHVESHPSSAV